MCLMQDKHQKWVSHLWLQQIYTVDWTLLHLTLGTSLVAQMVKNRPATWETWVQSLGCEERLGKEMATHSSIFAWRIPWTEEPGGL